MPLPLNITAKNCATSEYYFLRNLSNKPHHTLVAGDPWRLSQLQRWFWYIYFGVLIRIFGKDMNRRDSNKLSSFVGFVVGFLLRRHVSVSDLRSCARGSTWCVCLRIRKNSRRFVTSRVLQTHKNIITQYIFQEQENIFKYIFQEQEQQTIGPFWLRIDGFKISESQFQSKTNKKNLKFNMNLN